MATIEERGGAPAGPPLPAQRPAGAPHAFHLLTKPTGATCNLDCAYCFFLSKEMLYPGSRFRMADGLLQSYLRQLMEAHADDEEVIVAWQGGEPTLMGLEFFRRAVAYAEASRKPGQRLLHTIQTNGTLLDGEWAAFFRQHGFLVGISVDGPQAMHDAYRLDKGRVGTFDRVMRGLEHLRAAGVEYNTLTTLHAANAEHPGEVYRFLRDECGSRYLQFIPIIERIPDGVEAQWTSWRDRPLYVQDGTQVTARSITGEQYGRFLIAVFEQWVRRDVGTVFVQMFDVALANWVGAPPGLCVHAQTCGAAPAMEHTGDVYACDHFVEPAYRLGNIREEHLIELVASPKQQRFGQEKFTSLPAFCRACDVRFACHGGCPKDRFLHAPDGEPGLNYLCAGYKLFFHHIDGPMRYMAGQLRRNGAPSSIMAVYAEQERKQMEAVARAGRNDPCPCGSGLKVKHCHGRPALKP